MILGEQDITDYIFALKLNQLSAQLGEIDKGPGVTLASGLLAVGKAQEPQEGPEGVAPHAPLSWGPAWPAPHQ